MLVPPRNDLGLHRRFRRAPRHSDHEGLRGATSRNRTWKSSHASGHLLQRAVKKRFRDGHHIASATAALGDAEMFGGLSFRTFLDRWAATAGRYEGATAHKRPCHSRACSSIARPVVNRGDTRGG